MCKDTNTCRHGHIKHTPTEEPTRHGGVGAHWAFYHHPSLWGLLEQNQLKENGKGWIKTYYIIINVLIIVYFQAVIKLVLLKLTT